MKMRQAILSKNLSIYYIPKLVLSPLIFNLKKIPCNRTPPFSQSLFNFRFFTSKHDHSSSIQTSNHPLQHSNSEDETEDENPTQVEDVSNEELKQRIERYDKGDEGAILDIFEAIVRRKLAGRHRAESDDEILKEFRHDNPLNVVNDDDDEDEVDSDFDGSDSED